MEMNVDVDNLKRLFAEGLAPALDEGGEYHDLRIRLTHEILVYGPEVLPKKIFERTSGKEIAAMVCEDIEGAARILPLLEPKVVQPPTPEPAPAAEGEEAPEPAPEPIEIHPRVVHLSEGWGLPSVVLAVLRPEQTVEVIEPDPRRDWWWRRLKAVFSLRNLKVRIVESVDRWAESQGESVDVLLLKHHTPQQALDRALPLLRPGGRVVSWQNRDRAKEVRRPIVDPRGNRIELEDSYGFVSTVARPRTLLCVSCAEVEETAAV